MKPQKKFSLVCAPEGYRYVSPRPSEEDLATFYREEYYGLIKKGNRAPELRRMLKGGKEARDEREWLRATLDADVAYYLKALGPAKRVLDVGCGMGELVEYLGENGFKAEGIEMADDAVAAARKRNLRVSAGTLESFLSSPRGEKARFDAVTLMNVLEHVADPDGIVRAAKAVLAPSGIIVIKVPNDFTALQAAAQKKMKTTKNWWVALPDHLNYFSFDSLRRFLEARGFEFLHALGTFPMEFFLLMGDDYVSDPSLGGSCHKKRVSFDLSLPPDLRRDMFSRLAEVGVGRDCLMFARLKNKTARKPVKK